MYNVTAEYSENIAKPTRYSRIYGQIRTKDGTYYEIGDDDILEGTLSIDSKLNKKGDFRPGGVYSSCLSVTLMNFGDVSKSLNGAKIVMYYDLFRGADSDEYDRIPLGAYWIDGSTIKRSFQMVSFRADDDMVNFDYAAAEVSGTLYDLVIAACNTCGIPLRMSDAEFYALPNASLTATIDTSRIQIWRDLLLYVGIATGTFARINRTGGLEFIPLKCERDEYNMIIPVREIGDLQRFDTTFSDDTVCITKLITRRNGATASSDTVYTPAGSEQPATLELIDDPLFRDLADSELTSVLNNILAPLANCLNRAYTAEISGDPALEVGDYVRLRGGSIDTSRGYATGMITSQVWEYRKGHTIKCCLPASVARDESSVPAALGTEDRIVSARIPPKSQLEKQIDELKGQGGTAKRLQTAADGAYAETTGAGDIRVMNASGQDYVTLGTNDAHDVVITYNGGQKVVIGGRESTNLTVNDESVSAFAYGNGISIARDAVTVETTGGIRISMQGDSIKLSTSKVSATINADQIQLKNGTHEAYWGNGGIIMSAPNTELRIEPKNNLFRATSGDLSFEVNPNGAYINGTII